MTAAGDPSKPNQPTPPPQPSPRIWPRNWRRKAIAVAALSAAAGTLWIKGVVLNDAPRSALANSVPAARFEASRDNGDANANRATTRSSQKEEWSNKPVVAMRRNLFLIPTAIAAADPVTRPVVRQTTPPPAPVAAPPAPQPQPEAVIPTTQPSTPAAPQPQVIVVVPPAEQTQNSASGIQHGLSRNSRQQLAQSAYHDALDELSATDPDLSTAIWHLDSALNFNPDLTEAIALREKINAQLVSRSSGGLIDAFLRRQMLAGQTTRPSGGQQ